MREVCDIHFGPRLSGVCVQSITVVLSRPRRGSTYRGRCVPWALAFGRSPQQRPRIFRNRSLGSSSPGASKPEAEPRHGVLYRRAGFQNPGLGTGGCNQGSLLATAEGLRLPLEATVPLNLGHRSGISTQRTNSTAQDLKNLPDAGDCARLRANGCGRQGMRQDATVRRRRIHARRPRTLVCWIGR
jgi:hypothetical protein